MAISKRFFILLLSLLLPIPSWAAIAVNTSGNNGADNGGSTNTVTWNFDPVGAGCTNCALVVQLETDTTIDDVTGITFNGVAMTFLVKVHATGGRWSYTYGLLNPASGSHAIVATAGSTHYMFGLAVSYSGVLGFGATSTQTTSGLANITGNITTTTANSWVYVGVSGSDVSDFSGVTNSTKRGEYASFLSPAIFDNNTAIAAGAYSMTITDGSSPGDIGMTMVELMITAGGGGGGTSVAVNTFGNAGGENDGASTTVTWNFDAVGAGCTNCALLVQILGSNVVDDVTGATFNGTAMTLLNSAFVGWRYTYTYGLLNPASGNNAIVVTASGAHLLAGIAISYSGVSAFGATNSITGASSLTGSVTTTAANSRVFLGGISESATGWTGVTNATLRGTFATYVSPALFDNNADIASPGSYSMTVNSGAVDIAMVMVELKVAGGGGGTPTSSGGLLLRGVGNE